MALLILSMAISRQSWHRSGTMSGKSIAGQGADGFAQDNKSGGMRFLQENDALDFQQFAFRHVRRCF